jgi:hypothetical protein
MKPELSYTFAPALRESRGEQREKKGKQFLIGEGERRSGRKKDQKKL